MTDHIIRLTTRWSGPGMLRQMVGQPNLRELGWQGEGLIPGRSARSR
jgi:hypothetical protein